MPRPLDHDTALRVTSIIEQARRAGGNVPFRLNEAGLLLTKEREKHIRDKALGQMLTEFRVWMPHEFLRMVNRELAGCTPTDMYHAIHKWITDYVESIKRIS